MKKSNTGLGIGIAVLLIAAVYSTVLFLVKTDFDVSSWVLYGFTMVAFLLVGIRAFISARNGSNIVMETAFSIVTAVYFGLQFIFGGIVFMLFKDLPTTPVIVCEIIILAAYLVITFVTQYSNYAQDYNDRKAVQKMRMLESDVQGLIDEATKPEIKNALKCLAEAIHFSDIASLPELADVERRIAQNMIYLKEELTDEKADPLARIEIIHRLLKERDRTAAVLKR